MLLPPLLSSEEAVCGGDDAESGAGADNPDRPGSERGPGRVSAETPGLFRPESSDPTPPRSETASSSSEAKAPGSGRTRPIARISRSAATRNPFQRLIYLSRRAFCRAFKMGLRM